MSKRRIISRIEFRNILKSWSLKGLDKHSHMNAFMINLAEIETGWQVGLDVYGIGEHHQADFAVSAPRDCLAAEAVNTRKSVDSQHSVKHGWNSFVPSKYATIVLCQMDDRRLWAGRLFHGIFPSFDLWRPRLSFWWKWSYFWLVNEKTKLDRSIDSSSAGKEVYPRQFRTNCPCR